MSERLRTISKLLTDQAARASYIKAKLGVLVPAQIRALRLKSDMPRQSDLAREAEMQQSRISMIETPGAANVTLETLSRLAAVFKVGLVVKFVPFGQMIQWEDSFSQDDFDVVRLPEDKVFLSPEAYSGGILSGTTSQEIDEHELGSRLRMVYESYYRGTFDIAALKSEAYKGQVKQNDVITLEKVS